MKVSKISAEIGVSLEIKSESGSSTWYKFTYSEERILENEDKYRNEQRKLWNECKKQVNKQALAVTQGSKK